MIPPISPAELVAVLLAEVLFGLLYNLLVAYAHKTGLWKVLVSVIIGVAVTGAIPLVVWFDVCMTVIWSGALYAACFVASGIPMAVGFIQRDREAAVAEQKKSHKRQQIPPSAARTRDELVMDVTSLASEIAAAARSGQLKAGDLPDYVHRLHQFVGTLKSL